MLGSIGMITDQPGGIAGEMHFDPWGKRIDAADWDGDEQLEDIPLRFTDPTGFTDEEEQADPPPPQQQCKAGKPCGDGDS